jgi:hypothetical protein
MPTILTHSDIRVKAPAVFGLNIEFFGGARIGRALGASPWGDSAAQAKRTPA